MVHKVPGHSSLLCNLKQDRQQIESDVKKICRQTVPGWDKIRHDEDITVSEISGGITNLLWKLTPKLETGLEPVVARVFGEQTDLLIDRQREQEVLIQLNQAGFGAPVLSTFENGRVEGFLDMRTLTPVDMTELPMALRIACRLKQFHHAPVALAGDSTVPEPYVTLWKWLDMGKKVTYSDEAKQKRHEGVDFEGMARELKLTEEKAALLNSPTVWSHNDLLSGNVLVSKQDPEPRGAVGTMPSMQFIDFEYGSHSYRGYDWGNHFCEYAGFECDYSRYPDNAHIAHFVRAYLTEGAAKPPTDEEVSAGVAEANFFALVSHQFWGIWALIQARYSPIDFDYFSYSQLRWGEYYRRKDEFLAGIEPYLKR